MFKTFSTGVILGVIAAGAAAHFLPIFDLQREASIVSVQPNGGNAELFVIELPTDRILAGSGGEMEPIPASLAWPESPALAATGVELFKVRNTNNRVIGVASRLAAPGRTASPSVEWMLYLPARGAMYVSMSAAVGGASVGTLRAGTREFDQRRGQVTERRIADASDQRGGRIELRATLVAADSEDAGSDAT